jgi:hypothetical protein
MWLAAIGRGLLTVFTAAVKLSITEAHLSGETAEYDLTRTKTKPNRIDPDQMGRAAIILPLLKFARFACSDYAPGSLSHFSGNPLSRFSR